MAIIVKVKKQGSKIISVNSGNLKIDSGKDNLVITDSTNIRGLLGKQKDGFNV